MPTVNKTHDHNHNSTSDKDEDTENEKWNPTPAAMAAFLKRDYELARQNVRHALLNAGRPISLKEIKDSTLHSIDVIEKVLSSTIASDQVVEAKGRYSLVRS
jgi:hypothetical protein